MSDIQRLWQLCFEDIGSNCVSEKDYCKAAKSLNSDEGILLEEPMKNLRRTAFGHFLQAIRPELKSQQTRHEKEH